VALNAEVFFFDTAYSGYGSGVWETWLTVESALTNQVQMQVYYVERNRSPTELVIRTIGNTAGLVSYVYPNNDQNNPVYITLVLG
jgi:hypothetical protein